MAQGQIMQLSLKSFGAFNLGLISSADSTTKQAYGPTHSRQQSALQRDHTCVAAPLYCVRTCSVLVLHLQPATMEIVKRGAIYAGEASWAHFETFGLRVACRHRLWCTYTSRLKYIYKVFILKKVYIYIGIKYVPYGIVPDTAIVVVSLKKIIVRSSNSEQLIHGGPKYNLSLPSCTVPPCCRVTKLGRPGDP